jgi:CheY-like chemotaxis protein
MQQPSLKRILLVEDEPDIRFITTHALRALGGFEVEPCESGAEAVEKAADFVPDLVLSDVMMPGMDGLSTLQALRKLSIMQNVPVVFMTARVQKHEVEEYKALGVAEVIDKPFDPTQLPDRLSSIWSASLTN